jgi:hypothetical protein
MSSVDAGTVMTLAIPLAFLVVVLVWLGVVAKRGRFDR